MQRAETKSGKRPFMLVDVSLCIGCHACVNACKFENELEIKQFNTWIETWDAGEYPNVVRANVPHLCNHCDDAPCLAVCPTGATYRNDDGLILVDQEKCIGCKYCMAACPYGARYAIPETGVVGKCTYCAHRTENGLMPACVSTCVTSARLFGDLNDPDSDIAKAIAARGGADVLYPDMGQEPTLCYFDLEKAEAAERLSAVHKGGNVLKPYEGRS